MILSKGVAVVLILVGAVWTVQGFGVADTGSFMDRAPMWGWLGLGMIAAGVLMLVIKRGPGR
ncbi:MAG: hypothetical protein KY429_09645 [Actinobacteria bacterium]|nr:hypothetical protein [Actinomycetota bacterium]